MQYLCRRRHGQYGQITTETGKSDTRRQQELGTNVIECPAMGAVSMAWIFVVMVPLPWTWGGSLPPGAVQRKPDTSSLDPTESAEIWIKGELSEKLQSYGGLNSMVLSSKFFSIAWRSLPPQAQNCPSLSSLILLSCLRLPGIWKCGILPE